VTALIEARSVTRTFVAREDFLGRPIEKVHAVTDVSLEVMPGETLGLVGESGCGKSTLGRMLIRLLDVSAGQILVEGNDITRAEGEALRALRRSMQIVFQDPKSALDPRLTIAASLLEPLRIHALVPEKSEMARVGELLEQVGLPQSFANRLPHELSGGQRQRVGIARALAVSPRFIVLDEPVSALDVSVQAQTLNLLRDIQAQHGIAYLFVAHDLDVVAFMSHRVAVMYLGRIVEVISGSGLRDRARHPYTLALKEAVPVPDPSRPRRRLVLKGDMPSPIAPPPGCAFHTRCPFAKPVVCDTRVPPLEKVADGQFVACFRIHEIGAEVLAETATLHENG
jgi:oligopeptide transport system ATP-binding protein